MYVCARAHIHTCIHVHIHTYIRTRADLVQGYAVVCERAAATTAAAASTATSTTATAALPTLVSRELASELDRLLQRREALFAYTKRVSGVNRTTELKPHVVGGKGRFTYAVDPQTRYASLPADLPTQPARDSYEAELASREA